MWATLKNKIKTVPISDYNGYNAIKFLLWHSNTSFQHNILLSLIVDNSSIRKGTYT